MSNNMLKEKCSYCGTEIFDDAIHCSQCGAPLERKAKKFAALDKYVRENKKNKRWIIGLFLTGFGWLIVISPLSILGLPLLGAGILLLPPVTEALNQRFQKKNPHNRMLPPPNIKDNENRFHKK